MSARRVCSTVSARMREMRQAGLTRSRISEITGFSRPAVLHHTRDIVVPRGRWRDDERDRLARVCAEMTSSARLNRLDLRRLQEAVPGRTAQAIRTYLKGLRRRGEAPPFQRWWSTDELRAIATATSLAEAVRLLPERTAIAVARKAKKMRLSYYGERLPRRWSEQEMLLLRSRSRSERRRLTLEHGRTAEAISHARRKLRRQEARVDRMLQAITAAAAHVNPAIRMEVVNDAFVRVLSGEIALDRACDAVRKAVTKTYGPRHFSLDAPVADGAGRTWIDTIESDRVHF